jgi:ribonuclease HI
MSVLEVFTDGAASRNGRPDCRAAYSVVFPTAPELDEAARLPGPLQTNNRAETMAIVRALEIAAPIGRPLKVNTDSLLLVKTINQWMPRWKAAGWCKADGKPVANEDLMQRLDQAMSGMSRLEVVHVRAHTSRQDSASLWNAEADRRARDAVSG